MKLEPIVSIITVSYNSAKTINDTIESVLNQSYAHIEYVIVDGNSKDNTVDIIESYDEAFKKKGISYKWISEEDRGIYDAMNKAILLTTGELVGILNSDDWYEQNALEEIIDLFDYNNKLTIYAGEMNRVNENNIPYKINYNNKRVSKTIHKVMPINHPASFVHREVYNTIGLFDTQYKLSADYDFIFRAYKSGISFLFTDEIIVNMRNCGATSQLKNIWITAKEDLLIRKKNDVNWPNIYYIKKMAFNCLVYSRDTLKGFMKKK